VETGCHGQTCLSVLTYLARTTPDGVVHGTHNVEDFLHVAECRKFYPELLRGWPDNAVTGVVRMATPQEKMGTGISLGASPPFLPPRSLSGVFEFRRFGTVHEGARRISRRASLRYLLNGSYLPDAGLPERPAEALLKL